MKGKLLKIGAFLLSVLLIAASVSPLVAKYMASEKLDQSILLNSLEHLGIWEWRKLNDPDSLLSLDKLADDGFTVVYLDISDYVESPTSEIKNALSEYLYAARSLGLDVHALAGSPLWTQPSHRYLLQRTVVFVRDWNVMHPEITFSGLQFDLEPYTTEEFQRDPTKGVIEYIEAVDSIVALIDQAQISRELAEDFYFGLAIPAWFDSVGGGLPEISWRYENQSLFKHLVKIVSRLKNPYLAVLAYSNKIVGDGGVLALAKYELAFTAEYAPSVKIIVGQDIKGKPEESHDSLNSLNGSLTKIAEEFQRFSSFRGFAIHDTRKYEAIR